MAELFYEDRETADLALWFLGTPEGAVINDQEDGSAVLVVSDEVDLSPVQAENWFDLAEHAQSLVDDVASTMSDEESEQIQAAADERIANIERDSQVAIARLEQTITDLRETLDNCPGDEGPSEPTPPAEEEPDDESTSIWMDVAGKVGIGIIIFGAFALATKFIFNI